jgi:hypothetical protein
MSKNGRGAPKESVKSDQVHPEDEGQKGDEGNDFMYPFLRNQLTATANSQSNLAEPEITVSALFVSIARLPVCPAFAMLLPHSSSALPDSPGGQNLRKSAA